MFWQGANVVVLASKVVPETTRSDLFGVFFGSLGHRWGHLGAPVASQSPFKKFSKINRIFGDFGPPGSMPLPPAGHPRQQKTDIFGKSSDFAAERCKFSVSGFRHPLEKSVSLTFSEQWLCHFSKKFRWSVSGRSTRQ